MMIRLLALLLLLAVPGWAQTGRSPFVGSTKADFALSRMLTDSGNPGAPKFTTAALPACATNAAGWAFDTTTGEFKGCNGTSWSVFGSGGGGGGITSLNGLTEAVQEFINGVNVTITSDTDAHTIGWTGQLGFGQGGTGLSAAADDTVLLSMGTDWEAKAIADCVDTGGNHLNYTAASNTFSCGTSSSGASWSGLTSPTGNLALTMAARTSVFTYGATTGSGVNLFTLTDTTGNTGTGYLFSAETTSGSNALPFRAVVTTEGAPCGIGMDQQGVLQEIGTGCGVDPSAVLGGAIIGAVSTTANAIVRTNGSDGTTVKGYTSGAPTVSDTGGLTLNPTVNEPALTITSATSVNSPAIKIKHTIGDLDSPHVGFWDNSGNEWGTIDVSGAIRLCSGALYGVACTASIGPTDGSSIYSKGVTTIIGNGSANFARINIDGVAVGASNDAGIARSAAGVLKITDGGTNTRDLLARHTIAGGTAPTITANCGTSPSIAGMDGAGRVTVGTGGIATSCTVTFNVAWATAPSCVANDETTILLVQATATTTTLVLTAATTFVAADKLTYICVGY